MAEELGVERCATVEDLLRRADIVSVHLALKPETKKFLNAARLALLQPSAIFINTSRGEVVDQTALQAAVAAKKIRAGLDVFDPEPAESVAGFADPILDLPGLHGTHHIGASTEQAQDAIATEAVRIIAAYVKTGVVLNCVNFAKRTPAKWQMVVRHYDRVGVLAHVLDQLRRANVNVQEVQNTIFDGATAASCRLQLDTQPDDKMVAAIQSGNENILSIELLKLGE
jgi:D-3-phosphoglycerate dehydrogenase